MVKKIVIIIILLVINMGVAGFYLFLNTSEHSNLGSDSRGYVTKDIYSHFDLSNKKIAIITGMHPREISAKNVLPRVIKSYMLTHNVEIVNYQINVTDHPEDFTIGRHNGEGLVAKYVIPDIKKSDYDLVIIVHNHKKGYGNGYYIATPSMDAKSVVLGDTVHNLLPDFNYYKRSTDEKPESTSINGIDNPIVATGTPVFVYEIPEWVGDSDVVFNSNRLLDAIFKAI